MSFGSDIQAFSRGTSIKLDKVVRKVIIDMTSDIMKMTPVDTGAARSNWFWGASRVDSVDTSQNKRGTPSIQRAADFAEGLKGKAAGTFYLTNNLPYILALEFGSSKQAPSGMARVVVARWQQIVSGAVNSMSQGNRLDAIDSSNTRQGFKK